MSEPKPLPKEVCEELVKFASEQKYGFAQIVTNDMTIVLMGNVNFSPDQIAIIAAHALLLGILEGGFMELNQMMDSFERHKGKGRVN